MKNKVNISDIEMDIDYELFTAEEIIKIYQFFQLILNNEIHPLPLQELKKAYHEYRNIIRNQALEKKYDSMFQKLTGLSIYHIMKDL